MDETKLAAEGHFEIGKVAAPIGQQIEALFDAYVPGRREAREAALRLGYQGSRHGWYPKRPHRRKS